MKVRIEKQRESKKELSRDEEIQAIQTETKKMREAPDPQIVIPESDLKEYVSQGWQFVTVLPSQKIIVRK